MQIECFHRPETSVILRGRDLFVHYSNALARAKAPILFSPLSISLVSIINMHIDISFPVYIIQKKCKKIPFGRQCMVDKAFDTGKAIGLFFWISFHFFLVCCLF